MQMRAPAEAACGDYDVYVPGMTFVPTLVALPTAQLVVTQPYDTHVRFLPLHFWADKKCSFSGKFARDAIFGICCFPLV